MRARKNPPALTVENILAVLVPGRHYMLNAIALKFGCGATEIDPFLVLLIDAGRMERRYDHKRQRFTFGVRAVAPANVVPGRLVPTPSRIAWGFRDW